MTAPAAIVTVTIQGIDSLASSVLSTARAPYFLATIQQRTIGRSRAVPTSASSFDFTAEPQPWALDCAVGLADPVSVQITLYDDGGDDGPQTLATITGAIAPPWLPGSTTLAGPNGEVLTLGVATNYPLPVEPFAAVPRVADGTSGLATLLLPDVVVLTIDDVLGLWKPTSSDPDNRSVHVTGYSSDDDLGRIFLHRDYDKNWVAHHHQVEVQLSVTAVWGEVPPGAKVKWTAVDPDDPTNDDPGFHTEWGRVIDPRDYDSSGQPTGARPGDNVGTRTGATFVEVPGFALSGASATSAKTEIVGGASKVTFTGTNAAGDNFILRAELDGAGDAIVLVAQTGIMTMWHQVDVEYGKMPGAFDLPVDRVPPFFEPACVQLDFHAVGESVTDQDPVAQSEDQYDNVVGDFVESNFQHDTERGWFCVLAAKKPYPPPPRPPTPPGGWPEGDTVLWWNGRSWDHEEWFDLEGSFPGMTSAQLTWSVDGETSPRTVIFALHAARPWVTPDGTQKTRFFIHDQVAHDMTHQFTAGDGSWAHATAHMRRYFPQGFLTEGGSFVPGGYDAAHHVHAMVQQHQLYTAGTSPPKRGHDGFFAGRTIVFTHHPSYVVRGPDEQPVLGPDGNPIPSPDFAADIASVITHELGHAFGMPHVCGHFDWHAPRDRTCTMNYTLNWMRDFTTHHLVPGSQNKRSNDFCGLHLREIRKTDLTRNGALGWG